MIDSKRCLVSPWKPATGAPALLALVLAAGLMLSAADSALYRVNVNLLALTFSVSDTAGRPIGGLTPADVRIFEDGVQQNIAAFAQGSKLVTSGGPGAGTNIFILFNTSNQMYEQIPY